MHTSDHAIFGKIKYYDKSGKPHELNLIDKDSILNSYIFKQIKRNIRFPQYDFVREFFDPTSPKFDIGALVEAINIYQKTQLNFDAVKALNDKQLSRE
jgi:hypothetical protein